MKDKFKVISTKGYDDGYYWDYRIWFAYDEKEYTYMYEGSLSGYIECTEAIAKDIIDLPEGYRDSRFSSDVEVDKEKLISYVKKLLVSGEDEISLYNRQNNKLIQDALFNSIQNTNSMYDNYWNATRNLFYK